MGCKWDSLALYAVSGDDVTLLDIICGPSLPSSLYTSEDLLVEFISDGIQQRAGFRLRYMKINAYGGTAF